MKAVVSVVPRASSRWSISVEVPLPTSSTVAVLGSPVRRINSHEIVGFG